MAFFKVKVEDVDHHFGLQKGPPLSYVLLNFTFNMSTLIIKWPLLKYVM